jgi:predicted amidophosphoribosyltransferase
MALTLCPNCRLPVNRSAQSCPLCTATLSTPATVRHVPVAAAVALLATVAVLARRWA